MKPAPIKPIVLILFVILYNFFFWDEKLGLNLFLFSILLTVALLYFYKASRSAVNVHISVILTVVSAAMVLLHNSLVSKLAHLTSVLIMVGFLHVREYRTVYNALASYWVNFIHVIPVLFSGWGRWAAQSKIGSSKAGKSLAKLRFSFVPLVFFSIFFVIFRIANPIFTDLTDNFFQSIYTAFEQFFTNFSFVRLLFIIGGLYLLASFLYYRPFPELLTAEKKHHDLIERKRRFVKDKLHVYFKPLALKNEHTAALMLVVSVNVLLLVVNIIDIRWLWFNFNYTEISNFSVLLHDGTYMLILSILLSMGILLFYFRKNLNFYRKNQLLVQASYVWLFQNAVLAASVLLRCYYYMQAHGLAYKRIGVAVFLLLVYVGLYTLYLKISRKKSFFYLLRVNTWAAYVVFVLLSLANWDVVIVRHNLNHPDAQNKIDLQFLLTRSDKTLHLIDQDRSKIEGMLKNEMIHRQDFGRVSADEYLAYRIKKFQADYITYSWLSWNYAEHETHQYFSKKRQ